MGKNRICISLLLTITLITATTFSSFAATAEDTSALGLPVFPGDAVVQTVDDGNGGTYFIKSYVKDGVRQVEVTSDVNTDVVILTNENMEELTVEKYTLEDDGIASTPKDDEYTVVEEQYLIDEPTTLSDATGSLTYGNDIYETYKGNYFYAWGKSSYGNQYLRIGCVADYDLKYYSMTASQQSRCVAYTTEIKNVRAHIYNATLALSGENATLYAILAVVLVFAITVPPAAIELAVTAALGITGYAVTQVLGAREDYIDVQELYSLIKVYPHL